METRQDETLVSIPNVLLNRAEVVLFFDFLEKNTSKKKDTATSKGIPTEKTREQFEQLFQTWKSETALLSSATAIINHPAYQKMILMGDTVLPFMFIKLQNDPQHLFYALYQITGESCPTCPRWQFQTDDCRLVELGNTKRLYQCLTSFA